MDLKNEAAQLAYTFIVDNMSIGLGDGSTVQCLAGFIINGIKDGLKVNVYTSSVRTMDFLHKAGITVSDISNTDSLDMYFDGCDQVDNHLNALKSGAGIHTSEKLLAAMARKFIIMADASKFVSKLDIKFPLVLETLPQATNFVFKEMQTLYRDASLSIRKSPENVGENVITINNNYLIDCWFAEWPDPGIVQIQTEKIVGVVEISLFYNMVDEAIIAGKEGVARYKRQNHLIRLMEPT